MEPCERRSTLSNVASTAFKDMSHLTCFNSDKKGHYATKCPEPRKDRDTSEDYTQGGYSRTSSANEFRKRVPQTSSTNKFRKRVPRTSSVHLIPYHLPRKSVLALLNSENEVDAIYPTFAKKLALRVRPIAYDSLKRHFWWLMLVRK